MRTIIDKSENRDKTRWPPRPSRGAICSSLTLQVKEGQDMRQHPHQRLRQHSEECKRHLLLKQKPQLQM